jgi:5-dehydro-2-deoxygluconokinase
VTTNVDIWILGRIGYDLYAVEHNRPLSEVQHFQRDLGGSSANMAVGLSRLGLRVGIISAVGDDLLSDYLLPRLAQEGIDTHYVRRVRGYNTSLCLTEVAPPSGFHQVFYRARPADSQIVLSDEAATKLQQAKMFITNGTNLAETPARESAVRALEIAHQAKVTTVFDVDYRANSWASPSAAGDQARKVIGLVDVVFANEEELTLLTGTEDVNRQIDSVLSLGPKVLVQKLGARGVAAHTKGARHSAPSLTDNLVCAIGGGDGFASGFLYALYKGYELPRALEYGNAAAAIVVSRVTCSSAMPKLQEIEAHLAKLRTRSQTQSAD